MAFHKMIFFRNQGYFCYNGSFIRTKPQPFYPEPSEFAMQMETFRLLRPRSECWIRQELKIYDFLNESPTKAATFQWEIPRRGNTLLSLIFHRMSTWAEPSRETYFEIGARVVRPPPSPSREFLGFRKRSPSRKYVHTTTAKSFPPLFHTSRTKTAKKRSRRWATYVVSHIALTDSLLPNRKRSWSWFYFVLICFLGFLTQWRCRLTQQVAPRCASVVVTRKSELKDDY